MNVGIIHNKQDRTTGGRMYRAFTELGHDTTYYDYNDAPDMDKMGHHDFVLMIDNADWHIYPPPKDTLSFYYAVDTGIEGGRRCVSQSEHMNFRFFAQKRDAHLFNTESSLWLPHAFDDVVSAGCDQRFDPRTYLLSTVGDYESGARADRYAVKKLFDEFSETQKCFYSNNMTMKDMYNIYFQSVFVLNHNTYLPKLEKKDINLRVFEAAGCGAIGIMDIATDGLEDIGFKDGENCILYENDEDIFVRIKDLMRWPDVMRHMGVQSQRLMRTFHTYKHRAKKIIEMYENILEGFECG